MKFARWLVAAACTVAVSADGAAAEDAADTFVLPEPKNVFFYETFATSLEDSRWSSSEDDKFKEGGWKIGHGSEKSAFEEDNGLLVTNAAKHSAISTKFDKRFDPENSDFVVQYEVRFHKHHECGGAYLKILKDDAAFSPKTFKDDSEYIVMFGPDKCGTTDKVHFIFRHKSPKTGKYEEKHLKNPPTIRNDRNTHLYTLVIRKDNTYEIFIDLESVKKGSLHDDFEPPVNPPKEIDDPEDKKPDDWVDEAKIKDPAASKPDDWDEDEPRTIDDPSATMPSGWLVDGPQQIPDPTAEKPEDWDDDEDGAFEAPLIDNPACSVGCGEWTPPKIDNPKYKGKWVHPLIDNPEFKGVWAPRKIPNPDYFEDENPHALTPMGGIGIEIWTMQDGIEFDNIFVDKSTEAATEFAKATWSEKNTREKAATESAYSLGDSGLVGWLTENPVAAVITAVLGVLTLVYLIYQFCLSQTDEAEEDDIAENAEKEAAGQVSSDEEISHQDHDAKEGKEEKEEAEKEEEEEVVPKASSPRRSQRRKSPKAS